RRLRDQRQEAVNRLTEADRDMRRARDILNELSPRAEELRMQAAAAEEYQKVADALKTLQGSLARDAWRKAMMQLRRALARVQATEHKRAIAAQGLADFEPQYAEHRTALLQAREARWRHQEAMADVRLRLAETQHQARIAQERNVAAVQALESLQRELEHLRASERAGNRVVDELAKALESGKLELENANGALLAASDAERAAREALTGLEADRAGCQQGRQDLQRDRLAIEAELRQLEGRLQFLAEQDQQARTQLEAWSLRQGSLNDELGRRRREAESAERECQAATATASDSEHPRLRAVTPAGEVVTAVSYRGGKAADALLAIQARIREAEGALDRERQAALAAASAVEGYAAERASLIHERDAIVARVDELRRAAAQTAGALAAAGEGVQRDLHQELQVRQQLERVTTLSAQAEQLQDDALAR